MNPITLTDAAVKHIQGMLQKSPQSIGFRLAIKKTGCSGYAYVPDLVETIPAADFHFVAQDNLHVYVETASLPLLQNVTIDFIEEKSDLGLKQKRLVFINPQENGRCGCGESFNV